MNVSSLVADPAGNQPLPSLNPGGPAVNPKEHVEPGTGLAVVLGFLASGLGVLVGGLLSYGILWLVVIMAPIVEYFNRKRAMAALKGSAVQVGPEQIPELHQCAVTIAERLGMKAPPAVYIVEGNVINAAAMRLAGQQVVVLQDDIVDACLRSGDARTLMFILGHEMAHHALGHTGMLRANLSRVFKKLSRLDEFSCDAVAGVLVDDRNVSARAITVLTVGPQLLSFLNHNTLMMQAQEVNANRHSQKAEKRLTHPLLLRRLHRFVN
jgi:Zn-dependent protease with chaperone function